MKWLLGFKGSTLNLRQAGTSNYCLMIPQKKFISNKTPSKPFYLRSHLRTPSFPSAFIVWTVWFSPSNNPFSRALSCPSYLQWPPLTGPLRHHLVAPRPQPAPPAKKNLGPLHVHRFGLAWFSMESIGILAREPHRLRVPRPWDRGGAFRICKWVRHTEDIDRVEGPINQGGHILPRQEGCQKHIQESLWIWWKR